jgi:hypothetical protein
MSRYKRKVKGYMGRVAAKPKKPKVSGASIPPLPFKIQCSAPMLVAQQTSRQCTNREGGEFRNAIFFARHLRMLGWRFEGPGADWLCPFHAQMREREEHRRIMGVPHG